MSPNVSQCNVNLSQIQRINVLIATLLIFLILEWFWTADLHQRCIESKFVLVRESEATMFSCLVTGLWWRHLLQQFMIRECLPMPSLVIPNPSTAVQMEMQKY